jgi:DNA-binding NarL/FixJ family response regulator
MLKVLVVDDSPLMRKLITNFIRNPKKIDVVGEAQFGMTALEMVDSLDPDLVILDLHMSDMNGMQVLKEIKQRNEKTIVCILTNYPYPQYRTKCLALGADYFLNKNEDFEELSSVIEDVLKKTQQ